MTINFSPEYLVSLVHELRKLPQETEWVEFKENNQYPQEIGEYISALANSAALVGKAFAYLVWGIADADHSVTGTAFEPRAAKVGNEELENWLLHLLTPKIHFRFLDVPINDKAVVLLELHAPIASQSSSKGRNSFVSVPTKKAEGFPGEGTGALAVV